MENKDILDLAITTWGNDAQLDCTIEEMAELIKEIIKHKRGYDNKAAIIEEIADVEIMLYQLKKIMEIDQADIDEISNFKINRLHTRLKES